MASEQSWIFFAFKEGCARKSADLTVKKSKIQSFGIFANTTHKGDSDYGQDNSIIWQNIRVLCGKRSHTARSIEDQNVDWSECIYSRDIFSLSSPIKGYCECLQRRYRNIFESKFQDTHCDFRPGLSTTYKSFTLKQILEKFLEYAKDMFYQPLECLRQGFSCNASGCVAGLRYWRPPGTAFLLRRLCPFGWKWITTVQSGCWIPTG